MEPLYITEVKLKRELPQENYVAALPVVKNLKRMGGLPFHKPVTFFVGENGAGKSTLIEAIAVAFGFNPEGGTRNFNFNTCNSHSDLHEYITLVKSYGRPRGGFFLRAESFYNVSTNIDELDNDFAFSPPVIDSYGGVSLHRRSHGESFLAVVEKGFRENGLYILDEPEAALSPSGIMRLMVAVDALAKRNCQFIISTHSPMLISLPDSEVYEITDEGLRVTPYDQTGHYTQMKRFFGQSEKDAGISF